MIIESRYTCIKEIRWYMISIYIKTLLSVTYDWPWFNRYLYVCRTHRSLYRQVNGNWDQNSGSYSETNVRNERNFVRKYAYIETEMYFKITCSQGIAGLFIRISIQFSALDCDWKSIFKIGFRIWIDNPNPKKIINKLLVYDAKFKTIPSYNQKLKVMEDD